MSDPWQPRLSPKQLRIAALCHPRPGRKKFVLFSGPRRATKTVCSLNVIADHLWNVRDASFSVISPTVTAGDDSGCWSDLTERVLPEWIAGDFGMEWITSPRQKGTTKKLYCEVTNKFGGKSKVQLDSLQYEDEAEARFKNKSHSGIYVSELSYYKREETFKTWVQTLRGERYNEWDFMFLGDTNPADEGEDSWIWKLWYNFRVQAEVDEVSREYQKCFELVEWTIADNIFESKATLDTVLGMYRNSADLWARYAEGKWVTAVGNSIFFEQFSPQIHVIGELETMQNPDPEVLLPEDNCHELITGWDIGEHVNDGFHIMEKVMQPREIGKDEGKRIVDVSVFKVLDEVVNIGQQSSMSEFIQECLEKIQFWETFLKREVHWRNWSDRSAFDHKERISNLYHYQLVAIETNNKIILQAADRSPGSVLQRVELTKKLLFERRLFICRSRCPNLIDSMQSLKKGKGNIAVDKTSKFKHAFDSSSYAWTNECYDEILRPRNDPNSGRAGGSTSIPI